MVIVWVGALFAVVYLGLAALVALMDRAEQPSGRLAPTPEADGAMTRSSRGGWVAAVVSVAVFAATTVDLMTDGPLRHWDRVVIATARPAGSPHQVV